VYKGKINYNVKGGDLHLMVFSFCRHSYSCIMAWWWWKFSVNSGCRIIKLFIKCLWLWLKILINIVIVTPMGMFCLNITDISFVLGTQYVFCIRNELLCLLFQFSQSTLIMNI